MVSERITPGRTEKHEFFLTLTPFVYFQAPPNVEMKYPCIRYEIDAEGKQFADNRPFRRNWRYQVIVIDDDPDSEIRDAIADLPMCAFERKYVADDLHHFVFNLF